MSCILIALILISVSCSECDCADLTKKNGLWVTKAGEVFSGKCEKKDENGNVVLKMKIKNGLKHGYLTRYSFNGSLIFEAEYINGLPQGEYFQYFNDGRFKSIRLLHDSMYLYAGWGADGGLRIVREETSDSIADGRTVVYNEKGKVQTLIQFRKGIKIGKFMTWHDNGNPEMLGQYQNGSSDGMWLKLFPDGKLEAFELYENGKRNGTWKSYYNNGKLKVIYRFKDSRVIYQGNWSENGTKTDEFTREL